MSNRMTPAAVGSTSEAQPATASRASVSRETISSARPVSARTRSMNSAPFSAVRQASVAISRARRTLRSASLAPQTFERLDGALHGRLAEAAVGADALAEPDDAREGVDDAEAVVARRGDQQAAIVGAEIEGGIERIVGALAPRGRHDGRGGDHRRSAGFGATVASRR